MFNEKKILNNKPIQITMKTIRLLLAAMFLTTAAMAQTSTSPEVLIIGSNTSVEPEVYEYSTPEEVKAHIRDKKRGDMKVKIKATEQINDAVSIEEAQGAGAPLFIVSQKDNKFSFTVGGFVNLRTSYDFDGVVQNTDFVTAAIPVPGDYATHQQLIMDASTSRLYLQGVINSRAVGPVDIYVDMDFRGNVGYDETGVTNNYRPRLRRAYVSLLGITMGRDYTTFSDLATIPLTIDFEGPCGISFNYATVLRYNYNCCNDRLGLCVAIEQPNVSGTYGTLNKFEAIPQRVPDGIAYLEYKMGENRQHHLRASGVVRDMYYYDVTDADNTSLLGWGAQFSGNVMPCRWLNILFNGIYGEGITPYIMDLAGSGLDFTPNPENSSSLQTMPMYAWQAAASVNITKRLMMNGGYSTANVEKKNGYYSDDEYKKTQYIFGNLFYNVTPRFTVACEYIYGSRKNMDLTSNHANRASLMGQFNF